MQRKINLTKFTEKYLVFFLALVILLAIVILKIQSLNAWQYTSDIFTYDSFLGEIVFNQRFVEFTYGNQFGDHAYLFLFILYPAKLLLQSNHIYLLLILNPVLFFLSSISLYRVLLSKTNIANAIGATLSYMAGFGILYQGLMEDYYGFHPDLGAGFLLITITSILILQSRSALGKWSDGILLSTLCLIFLSYKEEMAVLGLIFFSLIFLITKEKRIGLLAILSIVIITVDIILINKSQTDYNRSNTSLLINFIDGINEEGIQYLFINSRGPQQAVIQYWSLLFGSLILFHLGWVLGKKINPYVLGLFYTGIVKLGSSMLLLDFQLTSWHGLPGAFMIIASLLFQAAFLMKGQQKKLRGLMASLVILSSCLFLYRETPFLLQRIRDNLNREVRVSIYSKQLQQLSDLIPQNRIVSIPIFSSVELVNHRFSFYPRGIHLSPIGIADYAIIPREVPLIFTGNYENQYPIEEYQENFLLIAQTNNFELYERQYLEQPDLEARKDFLMMMGLPELIPLP